MASTMFNPRFNISSISLKVASRCNLNCTYCYVYNKGDTSWSRRPSIMPDSTFSSAIRRIKRHCEKTRQHSISIVFHGGEPTLIGASRFDRWCEAARRELDGTAEVAFSIQTNATLLSTSWIDAFVQHRVDVGVSIDGPGPTLNSARVDKHGRSSYERALRGIDLLRDAGVPFGILSVVQFGSDPIAIHRGFRQLGCTSIGYILPHYTHDTVAPVFAQHGPTPCADFLIPIMDEWSSTAPLEIKVREFWNIGRLIMGGRSTVDSIGNESYGFLFVEADGEIQGLDNTSHVRGRPLQNRIECTS